ncbi:MAG: hypothetical protein WCA21_06840 [Terracidiphilus sp.]
MPTTAVKEFKEFASATKKLQRQVERFETSNYSVSMMEVLDRIKMANAVQREAVENLMLALHQMCNES